MEKITCLLCGKIKERKRKKEMWGKRNTFCSTDCAQQYNKQNGVWGN